MEHGCRSNVGGHRQLKSSGLSKEAYSELEFLSQHFFIVGLDKASNNACIIYTYHIRVHALHRLWEKDFQLALHNINDTISFLQDQLLELLPEIQFRDVGLPFLMATYKLHKKKYQWLMNVAYYLFTGPTTIITLALQLIISEVKVWCKL